MRVISGAAKGRKLKCLEGDHIRPTTDRIKETIFNIINTKVIEANVLDLFSGSGALGIEAISRGATATFVEHNNDAINVIKENLSHTKLEGNVIYKDVFTAIESLDDKFDIIFIDPPYYNDYEKKVLNYIEKYDLLKKNGIIMLEHGSKTKDFNETSFTLYREKVYKTTTLSFFKKTEGE